MSNEWGKNNYSINSAEITDWLFGKKGSALSHYIHKINSRRIKALKVKRWNYKRARGKYKQIITQPWSRVCLSPRVAERKWRKRWFYPLKIYNNSIFENIQNRTGTKVAKNNLGTTDNILSINNCSR